MQFDSSFINDGYPTNKLFTNTVTLSKQYPLSSLNSTVASTRDSFGSTKKTTLYTIHAGFSKEIEVLSSGLVKALKGVQKLDDFEAHVLTRKAEFWKQRGSEATSFNAIRFTIVVNHTTKKLWITPILTVVETSESIPEESLEEILE